LDVHSVTIDNHVLRQLGRIAGQGAVGCGDALVAGLHLSQMVAVFVVVIVETVWVT
jgi:hypothetical protein